MSRIAPCLLLGFLVTTGCAPVVRDLARTTTPAVVEGSVAAVTDPRVQEQMVQGIREDVVERGTDRLVSGIVDGTLATMNEPERREAMRAAFAEMTKGFQLPLAINGISAPAIGAIIDEVWRRLATDERSQALRVAARVIVADLVSTAFTQARKEMQGVDIGENVGSTARLMSKQAALGFQDAIDETSDMKRTGAIPKEHGNVLDAAGRAAESGPSLLWLGLAGLGGFALALLAAVISSGLRARGLRSQLVEREDALVAIAGALKGAEARPWGPELRELLRDSTLFDRQRKPS